MRNIVPMGVYTNAAAKISEQHKIDDALAAIWWALSNNAEDFPIIPGFKTLRMAKTDAIRNIPALHVVFKIIDGEVHLKWIEIADSDEFRGPPVL
jgi:hypothetical protein